MADIQLKVEPRTVARKKTRFLRRAGITPANIYGSGQQSVAVQAPTAEIKRVLRAAGHTNIVNLALPGERASRPALIAEVQHDALGDELLHVDFHQVDLTVRLSSDVPLVITGDSEAVRRGGVLLQVLNSVSVEALPAEIPAEVVVDVSNLESDDDAIFVRDLPLPPGVVALSDPDTMVLKVQASRLAQEVAAEDAEAAEAAAGEQPAEESAPEE